MEKFSVSLPLTGEYLTTVRLTTGGLCLLAGFDMDIAEDFKVCVTESLLILKRSGFLRANIGFTVGEALRCVVCGEGKRGEKEDSVEDEISRALLSARVGEVKFVKDPAGEFVKEIVFEG